MAELYAGHSQHCECKQAVINTERAYCALIAKAHILQRIVDAAEKNHHSPMSPCYICLGLQELHAFKG